MKFDKNVLKTLAIKVANNEDGINFNDATFSNEQLNKALHDQFKLLAPNRHGYEDNKKLIFRLLEETVDELLPKRVFDSLNSFAEIKTVANGEKITFNKPKGHVRGRNFVTQVSPAGLYEVFKLDREVFDMPTTAYGAAVMISFEEYLEGRIDFPELIQIITEGYEEVIYKQILRHMVALKSDTLIPANNVRSVAGWDPRGFANLLGISSAYDTPTIFTSFLFASEILPEGNMMTTGQKEEYARSGRLATYKGVNVVVLPHSFYNESNEASAVTLPLGMAWILPASKNKPVKIAFEGETYTKEVENDDWSKEIHFYKKIGTAVFANPAICIYENTALNNWPAGGGIIITDPTDLNVVPTYTRLV